MPARRAASSRRTAPCGSGRDARSSLQPRVLREVVIRGARAFELPAHLSGPRPGPGENLGEKLEQHAPGLARLFGAVAPGHGVVEPAVRHVPEYFHAVAAAAL